MVAGLKPLPKKAQTSVFFQTPQCHPSGRLRQLPLLLRSSKWQMIRALGNRHAVQLTVRRLVHRNTTITEPPSRDTHASLTSWINDSTTLLEGAAIARGTDDGNACFMYFF
jgi:hypothetical protein